MVILFGNPLRVLINYELQSPHETFLDCLEEVLGKYTEQRHVGLEPIDRKPPTPYQNMHNRTKRKIYPFSLLQIGR